MERDERSPHLIDNLIFSDERGKFSRIDVPLFFGLIKQNNFVLNKHKGLIRGLHWQSYPKNEKKIVRVIKGKIFDVIVDIRKDSLNYGKFKTYELNEDGPALYVPEGFAHGYQTLSKRSEMIYLHSESYYPDLSRTLLFDDKSLNIQWPYSVTKVSDKDIKGIKFNEI